jgi:lipopolysaccharide transport system permease protein
MDDKSIKLEKELIIKPPQNIRGLDFTEYYRYRHMLKSLVRRDIKSQFEDMYLGYVWATVRPLSVALVFKLFKSSSGANTHVSVPYVMFVYSGLIFWYYFTDAVMQTAGSVRKDSSIISKLYFPRLITPMVPILSNLIGLGIAAIPLLMMMSWYQILPSYKILLLPAVVMQCMALAFGVGTLFAALTVTNRDLEQFLSFAMYIGLFVSPVFFIPDMLPAWARAFSFFNPMAGTLLAFRACIFTDIVFPTTLWAYSCAFTIFAVTIGSIAFRYAEATFVDNL